MTREDLEMIRQERNEQFTKEELASNMGKFLSELDEFGKKNFPNGSINLPEEGTTK